MNQPLETGPGTLKIVHLEAQRCENCEMLTPCFRHGVAHVGSQGQQLLNVEHARSKSPGGAAVAWSLVVLFIEVP